MPKLSTTAIKRQIALLQKRLIAAEKSKIPAIKRVKALMKKLGIQLEDLADHLAPQTTSLQRRGRPRKAASDKTANSAGTRKVAIKYRDDKGNTWSGRGKTPRWLVTAEKTGKGRDAFKV
jgi:DNA-binding protein H-NS